MFAQDKYCSPNRRLETQNKKFNLKKKKQKTTKDTHLPV